MKQMAWLEFAPRRPILLKRTEAQVLDGVLAHIAVEGLEIDRHGFEVTGFGPQLMHNAVAQQELVRVRDRGVALRENL